MLCCLHGDPPPPPPPPRAAVTSEIWQKYNPLLHGGAFSDEPEDGGDDGGGEAAEDGPGRKRVSTAYSEGDGTTLSCEAWTPLRTPCVSVALLLLQRALLRLEWVRKYITAAKNNAARLAGPRLTKAAAGAIVEAYSGAVGDGAAFMTE